MQRSQFRRRLNRDWYLSILSFLIIGFLILLLVFHYHNGLKMMFNKGWYFYKDPIQVIEKPINFVKNTSLAEMLGMGNSEDETTVPSETFGYVRVESLHANIRTTPEVPANNNSNIYGQVEKGVELPYYGKTTNDSGGVWYKLMDVETGEKYWISGITVEIVK